MNARRSGRRDVFLDVAPLFEPQWTGIPIVTARLAEHGLARAGAPWRYLHNNQEIPRALVERLLADGSGRGFEGDMLGVFVQGRLPGFDEMAAGLAIFPNVKPVHGMYGREAVVVHDLSTLLTPQYHNRDTIQHHANRFRGDIASSDALICVSQATMDDVACYFDVAGKELVRAPLGVTWRTRARAEAADLLRDTELDRYAVVLGTVEPRKNIGLVLDFLRAHPAVLDEISFVFMGRDGWLDERARLEGAMAELGIDPRRMIFTGFVSDGVKLALLSRADFSIYPSLFEGFGLPVIESLSVDCPVLCSSSSSLPEIADESCVLFDPTDLDAFAGAFREMRRRTRVGRRPDLDPATFAVPPHLRWDGFYAAIDGWLEKHDG